MARVLIAGALGIAGRAALEHFEKQDNWEIVAVSRRKPDFNTRAHFISVDLNDKNACREALEPLEGITHVVYTALHEKAGSEMPWADRQQIAINTSMFRNCLNVVARMPELRHITFLQGGKAYGLQYGAMNVPGRETDPRHMPPNFYWEQEDLIRRLQVGRSWYWTALRPMALIGFSLGSPMNIISAIGAYAAICRRLNVPFRFPGGLQPVINDVTDTRLLARAISWAGHSPAARNEAFNVTNGDVIVWRHLWSDIADHLGFTPTLPQPLPLQVVMADKQAIWSDIVREHQLACDSLELIAGRTWSFADGIFNYADNSHPALLSTVKIRQAGFDDCVDSRASVLFWMSELQRRKILPPMQAK